MDVHRASVFITVTRCCPVNACFVLSADQGKFNLFMVLHSPQSALQRITWPCNSHRRHRNDPSRSLFWEYSSRPQCLDGLDAGHNEDPLRPDSGQLSLLDRRALAGWLVSSASSNVQFLAPTWRSLQRVSTVAAAT
ncbi:hypothetical protein V5799_016368 [Amblyomma americanum]|uniref:Uncharacterized protein n=1 Tax=Amblyomma americanum TaxID=6943 RepID=A0AAQ4F584_AMBAM